MRTLSFQLIICTVLFAATLGGAATGAAGQTEFRPTLSPWEGLYLGVHAGYGWGDIDVVEDPRNVVPYNGAGNSWSFPVEGAIAGVHVGINWESYRLLMGLEAGAGYMQIEGDGRDPASPGLDTVAMQADGTYLDVTGRIGFAPDNWLFYMKGGVAFADLGWSVKDNCTAPPCSAKTINAVSDGVESGWTAGAGIAWAFTQHTSLRMEYAYYDLGEIEVTGVSGGNLFSWQQDVRLHTVNLGLSFMF